MTRAKRGGKIVGVAAAKKKGTTATATKKTRSSRSDEPEPEPEAVAAKAPKRNSKTLPTLAARDDKKNKGQKSNKQDEDEDKKPAATTKPAATIKGARPRNFDVAKEDLYLCQAYVNVSTDPTTGNNQKGDTFWARVAAKFAELRDEDDTFDDWPERDGNAVMNRFQRQIQKHTQLYNSFYSRVKAKNKSGTNEADYIAQAASDYLEAQGKPFPWTHCIEILHKIPKLDPNMPDLTGDDSDDEAVNKIGDPMGAGKKRPQGSKAAKAKAKKAKLDAYSVASMETRKTNSMEAVGQASVRIADSSEFKAMQESMMEEARLYMQMGMTDEAKQLMEKVKANHRAYPDKINRREDLVPKEIDIDESVPSQTSSGHILTEKEKEQYRIDRAAAEGGDEDDDEEEDDDADMMGEEVRKIHDDMVAKGQLEPLDCRRKDDSDEDDIEKAKKKSIGV